MINVEICSVEEDVLLKLLYILYKLRLRPDNSIYRYHINGRAIYSRM